MKKIYFLIAAIAVMIAGIGGFGYYKMVQYEKVINTQGVVLKLIFETPEINKFIVEEVKRQQASSTPQK